MPPESFQSVQMRARQKQRAWLRHLIRQRHAPTFPKLQCCHRISFNKYSQLGEELNKTAAIYKRKKGESSTNNRPKFFSWLAGKMMMFILIVRRAQKWIQSQNSESYAKRCFPVTEDSSILFYSMVVFFRRFLYWRGSSGKTLKQIFRKGYSLTSVPFTNLNHPTACRRSKNF